MKIGLWVESPELRNKLNEASAFAQFALNVSESIGTSRLKTYLNINRPIYRVIQEESARLWEMIVCVIISKKVHMNMGPILNGYGVKTA